MGAKCGIANAENTKNAHIQETQKNVRTIKQRRMTMAEYIERDVLLKAVEKMDRLDKETGAKYEYNKEGYILLLKNAPTIEAKPVVHAHWIEEGEDLVCSNCEEYALWNCECYSECSKYCPYCGAQMDELVSKTDELNSSEKPNNSVKIPVISMEDVPKVMEELKKSGKPRQNQQKGNFKAFEEGQT